MLPSRACRLRGRQAGCSAETDPCTAILCHRRPTHFGADVRNLVFGVSICRGWFPFGARLGGQESQDSTTSTTTQVLYTATASSNHPRPTCMRHGSPWGMQCGYAVGDVPESDQQPKQLSIGPTTATKGPHMDHDETWLCVIGSRGCKFAFRKLPHECGVF
jgi:hypothetical protein